MSVLLSLVPWYYRALAIAGLFAAGVGWGYLKGYEVRDRSADLDEAKVQALAEDAARRAGETKRQQDQTTKEIRNEHADDVSRIRAYYDSRLRDAGRVRAVPAAPQCPVVADGAPREPEPRAEDPGRAAFELSCALDAVKVMKLQDFLHRNNFPIR